MQPAISEMVPTATSNIRVVIQRHKEGRFSGLFIVDNPLGQSQSGLQQRLKQHNFSDQRRF
jgi:hypothetical protein